MKKRGKLEELASYKERNRETNRYIAQFRPHSLKNALHDLPENCEDEFLRYFPVALVNAIEVYFKVCIEEMINHNSIFSERSEPLARAVKIDFEMINALQGKLVTLGEIIAHSVSFGNYSSISNAMSCILGNDFTNMLKTVHSRRSVEILGEMKRPIINNLDETIQVIQEMYSNRHIITHEMLRNIGLDRNKIALYIYHTGLFLNASEEIVSEALNPGSPLTQSEMTISANSSFEEANEELKSTVEYIRSNLLIREQVEYIKKLEKSQSTWERMRHLDAQLEADEYLGGSLWPMFYNNAMERITRDRINSLKFIFSFIENDDGRYAF